MKKQLVWLASAALLLAVPAPAAAFRDHDTFALPVLEGGGADRWFTGSPRDGYTCAVCHVGEDPPADVELTGIPADGWMPDEVYSITLTLPVATAASAVLEITDADGAAIGTLSAPADLESGDQCDAQGGLPPEGAIFVMPAPEAREVGVVDDCGADRLRVEWRAPSTPAAGVTLYAVAVAGDGDVDPAGDGVRAIVRRLPAAGDSPEGPRVGTACAVGARRPSAHAWLLGLALALLARKVR